MAYIWENYSEENYYYIPKKGQSYYQEVWKNSGILVPVNVFNRFGSIFYPVQPDEDWSMQREVSDKYKNDEKFKDIVNIMIHQLAFWDRLNGMTLEDLKMSLIYDDMKEGLYGDKIKDEIDILKFEDLYIILKELAKNITGKNREVLFDEVLHLLFGKVIFYKENSTNKTMIYIEQVRNEYREKLFEIVTYLFADMGLKLESFWANEHFGLIGNESTMKIGRINIY